MVIGDDYASDYFLIENMKKPSIISLIIIILVFTLGFVSSTAEEYLYEFNNEGETCVIDDYFYYDLKCSIIFNSDRLCTTIPVLYTCCDDSNCKTIIFDIQNREFLNDQRNSELIDLNYIKYNLQNGNLSLIQFDLSGFDICSFFGKKDLKRESLNLAASAAERIAPLLEIEKARRIKNTINTTRRIGKVSTFNPVSFAASGTCIYDDDRLTLAITSISNYNTFLENINNNYAQEGYMVHFISEVGIARVRLKDYVDSTSAILRNAANTVGNTAVGIFNFFKNLFVGEVKELEIKKSEYDYAKEAYSAILSYEPKINNPKNVEILLNHNIRVSSKIDAYNTQYLTFENLEGELKDIKPGFLKILFSNIFLEPNYNISSAKESLKKANQLKKESDSLIKGYKFNSATSKLIEGIGSLNVSIAAYSKEATVDRRFSLI